MYEDIRIHWQRQKSVCRFLARHLDEIELHGTEWAKGKGLDKPANIEGWNVDILNRINDLAIDLSRQ